MDKEEKTALSFMFCRSFPAWLMQGTCLYFLLCLPVSLFHWVRSDSFLVTGHRRARKLLMIKLTVPPH